MKTLKIFSFLAVVALAVISCEKSSERPAGSKKSTPDISSKTTDAGTGRIYNPCLEYSPMVQNADGTYQCLWGMNNMGTPPANCSFKVTSPYFQTVCPATGLPLGIRNGDPIMTSIINTDCQSSYIRVFDVYGANNVYRHFVLAQGTLSAPTFYNAVQQYQAAWQNFVNNVPDPSTGITNFQNAPNFSNYAGGLGSSVIYSTGKFIRINGGSTFAIAPECYPEPGSCSYGAVEVQ